jgi:hypothetical protein
LLNLKHICYETIQKKNTIDIHSCVIIYFHISLRLLKLLLQFLALLPLPKVFDAK